LLGVVSGTAATALVKNVGGDNLQPANQTVRDFMSSSLEHFHELRANCARLVENAVKQSDIATDVGQLLPAFQLLPASALTTADTNAWRAGLAGFQVAEKTLAAAIRAGDLGLAETTIAPLQAFERLIARRNHSGLGAAHAAIVRECLRQASRFRDLQVSIRDALVRPANATGFLRDAAETLEDYVQSKAGCAAALGMPATAATIYLRKEDLIRP
jgi:hypothetical protein